MKRSEFSEDDKIKCLLWCNRHCCLCGKACGVNIEIAHFDPEKNDVDNAIPLCFECHSEVGRYNEEHPKGNKYKTAELKKRRDQMYEEYTRALVPPINYEISQILPNGKKRDFPDVGFNIFHMGDSLPVRILTQVILFLGGKELNKIGGHYSGEEFWNLNPRHGYTGHFLAPEKVLDSSKRFEVKVYVTIVDQYEKYHELLPMKWVYERNGAYWWANP